jgi:hypothetical protein
MTKGSNMGQIEVRKEEGVLVVTMSGRLTLEIVEGMRTDLLGRLGERTDARILYDSRQVELTGDRRIPKRLAQIDQELQPHVARMASLLPDYTVGTTAGQVHVYSRVHERFYDFDDAMRWLRTED